MWSGFSFQNYTTLFKYSTNLNAKKIWDAARNTALVAITAGLISTILGTLGAIGMYYTRKKWMRNSLEFVNQIPVVNAEIVTAVSLCVYCFSPVSPLFPRFIPVACLPSDFSVHTQAGVKSSCPACGTLSTLVLVISERFSRKGGQCRAVWGFVPFAPFLYFRCKLDKIRW